MFYPIEEDYIGSPAMRCQAAPLFVVDPAIIGLSVDVTELCQMEKYKSKSSYSDASNLSSQYKHI